MSYNMELVDAEGKPLPTDHFVEGGTRNLYGTNECDLNITGNYWSVWRLIGLSPRDLDGQTGQASLTPLRAAVESLGGNLPNPPQPFKDYWAATPGNALVVARRLLAWAEEHPQGLWRCIG